MTALTEYQRRIVDEYIDFWRDFGNCPREKAQDARTDYELLESALDAAMERFRDAASPFFHHDDLADAVRRVDDVIGDLREHMAALDAVPSGKDLADEERHERERAADYRSAAI